MNGNDTTSSNDEGKPQSSSGNGWISKRDRHAQLINTNIFDKETQARSKAMAETRRQKAMARDRMEKQKIQSFLRSTDTRSGNSAPVHELTIDGLQYHIMNGGSKLARVRGESGHDVRRYGLGSRYSGPFDSGTLTPKQATVGGVAFLRSKNGNLYRSGIVEAKKYDAFSFWPAL